MGRPLALLLLAALPARAGVIEAVVKDGGGNPVADAVVFLRKAAPKAGGVPAAAEMAQVDLELVPGLVVVPVGGKVSFPNKDATHHHLYSFSPAKPFDIPLYKGEDTPALTFDKPGVVKVGCNIHDWMSGVVFVAPTPHFARTGPDGRAALDVPDGKVEVSVFHERLKGPVDATTRKGDSGKAPLRFAWTVELKKARPSKRPAVGYQ